MSNTKPDMINKALRLLRLYLGLSQQQIAAELELSQSMISEIESGAKQVSLVILKRYSTTFDVRMSQLMLFAEQIDGEPIRTRGKLLVAPHVLRLLETLAPKEVA